jgi:beta-lactamase superfamily II metal-dependent hydrolase
MISFRSLRASLAILTIWYKELSMRFKELSMRFLAAVFATVFLAAFSAAQTRTAKTLDIYIIDVEGGNSVLFVAPSGESVLIDTGNRGAAASRDADRILAAVKDAGLSQIDHLITTHWHGDHFGGLAEVASRISIRDYIDHGPSIEPAAANDEFQQKGYPALYAKAKHTVLKPGDTIPVAGLDWRVVSSAGEVLKMPLPGAGKPNPDCGNYQLRGPDRDPDNDASLGSVISFGKFRAVHLGDLTQDKEHALMCPSNRIGKVDLFIVSHHGLSRSNSRALVHAIAPKVIIMNN